MFQEENAITYRITKMQKLCSEKITPNTQLIKWLIESNEKRMLNSFVVTEASEQGRLPELFVTFDSEFTNTKSYGKELTNYFLGIWTSEEARKEVESANVLPNWDHTPYLEPKEPTKENEPFLDCMSSFALAVSESTTLILFLNPPSHTRNKTWVRWIEKLLLILPSNIIIMIADYKEKLIFEEVYNKNVSILDANLDMQGAIKELIKSGDTNNPAVGINLCLVHIAEAVDNNDKKSIDDWAKKGLTLAEKLKLPSIEATVLLAHGSAYFSLKKLKKALSLYAEAESVCIKGLQSSDMAVNSLLLQTYHFQASVYLHRRKKAKALEYYLKTAQEAKAQNNMLLYLESMRQSAYISRKMYDKQQALKLLKEVFEEVKQQDTSMLKFSAMLMICDELNHLAEYYGEQETSKEVHEFATNIWGERWQEMSQKEVYENILTESKE